MGRLATRFVVAVVIAVGLGGCGSGGSSGGGSTGGGSGPGGGPIATPSPPGPQIPAADAQNVIVFIADDLGWRDVGYAGSTFHETPNIDALAAAGMVFTSAYSASPVCSPTRAALMTGLDPARLGMTTIINDQGVSTPTLLSPPDSANHLDPALKTMGEYFKDAGYKTMFSGKWHIGESANHWPENEGFDVNRGGAQLGAPIGSPSAWYSPYRNARLPDGPAGEFLEDRLTSETISFIRSNTSRPFFITHAFYLPHLPMVAIQPHFPKYEQRNAGIKSPFPAARHLNYGVFSQSLQAVPHYGSMVQSLDDQVGKIVAELKAQNLYEKTVIVFVSDNGGFAPFFGGTSNEPLRGGKTWLYEGGVRVPMVIRAPGSTVGGSRSDYVTRSEDLLPTLLNLTKLVPASSKFDGVNLFAADRPAARTLVWHYPHYHISGSRPATAIRHGNWKLIQFLEDNSVQLYDLAADPGETTDLAAARADIVSDLLQRLDAWRANVGARMPTPR